jgi:hypothetical protein
MDALSQFLPLILVILIGVLLVPTYRLLRHRKQGTMWGDFAARQGLTFDPTAKTLSGNYRGRPILMDIYYHSAHVAGSRTSSAVTRAVTSLARVPQGSYLHATISYGIAADQLDAANRMSMERNMNMHYVHTGDREIDKKVAISAPSSEFAAQVLTSNPAIRQAILDRGMLGTLILEGQQLRYEWNAIETKEEKLQVALDLLSNAAEIIEGM